MGRDANGRFTSGHNLGGRPPGTRNKTDVRLIIHDVLESWEQHGLAVLNQLAQDQPVEYLRFVARIFVAYLGKLPPETAPPQSNINPTVHSERETAFMQALKRRANGGQITNDMVIAELRERPTEQLPTTNGNSKPEVCPRQGQRIQRAINPTPGVRQEL